MTSTGPQFDFTAAEFMIAVHELRQLPADVGAEIAFAGRSNVGKSSVINALCHRRKLARTSRTPGRTQQLVVFGLAPDTRFVDLPGFGYAKVAKSLRDHWRKVIPVYLQSRRSLLGLVLITDVRHPLRAEELDLLSWCNDAGLRANLVLNKADKLSRNQARQAVLRARRELSGLAIPISAQAFSATAKTGVEALEEELRAWFSND
jgi:GTP-binding protein